MDIHLDEYNHIDQQQVKDFILDAWKEFGFVYIQEYDSDLDDPQEYYIKPGGMFYVLKDENNVIGTIGIINKGNNIAELKRFYVALHLRGNGYGNQLFNQAIEFCRSKGFKKVEFETGKAFKQGHVFYKKRGFTIVKQDEESYYMEKSL